MIIKSSQSQKLIYFCENYLLDTMEDSKGKRKICKGKEYLPILQNFPDIYEKTKVLYVPSIVMKQQNFSS